MNTRLMNTMSYFTADSRRAKIALFAVMAFVFAVTHLVPGAAALAGPMGGGSGICGNC